LARPICELKGFEKIFIPAGETRTVSFTLSPEQLGYWHEENDGFDSRVWYATDKADFEIRISPDCR
jgi:beta-glucosidase